MLTAGFGGNGWIKVKRFTIKTIQSLNNIFITIPFADAGVFLLTYIAEHIILNVRILLTINMI